MKEWEKEKIVRWIAISILVLLFVYGFEYELNYFYNENIGASDYLMGLVSCLLLLIYIIPLGLILFGLGSKLGINKQNIILCLVCVMFIPGFLAAFANDQGDLLVQEIFSEDFYLSWGLAFTAPIN